MPHTSIIEIVSWMLPSAESVFHIRIKQELSKNVWSSDFWGELKHQTGETLKALQFYKSQLVELFLKLKDYSILLHKVYIASHINCLT